MYKMGCDFGELPGLYAFLYAAARFLYAEAKVRAYGLGWMEAEKPFAGQLVGMGWIRVEGSIDDPAVAGRPSFNQVVQEGREHLIRWYCERARGWLGETVRDYAVRMEVQPAGVKVQDLGYRWGSCVKGDWLVLLPCRHSSGRRHGCYSASICRRACL